MKIQLEALPDSDGESFVPIITDLWRRTQPIIRYRLNDVLQMNHKLCGCGSTFRVIHAIEGRCDDICYFTAIEGGTRPFYPDTVRRMILLASPDIVDYRVLQERPGQLMLYLEVSKTASFGEVAQSVVTSVHNTLEQYNCRQAEVIIEEGLPMQIPGEKLRRVRALRG